MVVRTRLNVTYLACLLVLMLVLHVSVCALLKIRFLRIAFLAQMYVRKLNVTSVLKRPFHQNTDIFESRGDACLDFTIRLDDVAAPTFVNSRCILYVLLPAVLPSQLLSVSPMIRNVSVVIKYYEVFFLSCTSNVWDMHNCLQLISVWPVRLQ
jgi:hypothetical protein